LEHVIAAKAVCFHEALQPSFKVYAQQIVSNARALAAGLMKNGYRITSGGTDNHLMLVDLRPNGLNGKIASETLDHAGITVNKNGIPFDTEKISLGGGSGRHAGRHDPRHERGTNARDCRPHPPGTLEQGQPAEIAKVRTDVRALTSRYPLPG